jgi:hypothetical protein
MTLLEYIRLVVGNVLFCAQHVRNPERIYCPIG